MAPYFVDFSHSMHGVSDDFDCEYHRSGIQHDLLESLTPGYNHVAIERQLVQSSSNAPIPKRINAETDVTPLSHTVTTSLGHCRCD